MAQNDRGSCTPKLRTNLSTRSWLKVCSRYEEKLATPRSSHRRHLLGHRIFNILRRECVGSSYRRSNSVRLDGLVKDECAPAVLVVHRSSDHLALRALLDALLESISVG